MPRKRDLSCQRLLFDIRGGGEEPDSSPSLVTPRDYQNEVVGEVYAAWAKGHVNVLSVVATGLGKTNIAAFCARLWIEGRHKEYDLSRRTLFLSHRTEILDQAERSFKKVMPAALVSREQSHRVVACDEKGYPFADVVIASVATLSRPDRLYRLNPSSFGQVVVDECHHWRPKNTEYTSTVNYFRGARVLGQTATPDRGDGCAMRSVFDYAIKPRTMLWGIENGWLVPVEVFRPVVLSTSISEERLARLEPGHGERALAEETPIHANIANVLLDVRREAGRAISAIIFAPSVTDSQRLAEVLNRRHDEEGTGKAAHVDCQETEEDERERIMDGVRAGHVSYLTNYNIFGEGTDVPSVDVVVLGRQTHVRAAVEQWVGRGIRPHDSVASRLGQLTTAVERRQAIAASLKPRLLVVDVSGNTLEHKLVTPSDVLGGWIDSEVGGERSETSGGGTPKIDRAAQRERRAKEAARRKALLVDSVHRREKIDPFNVLDVGVSVPTGRRRSKPASDGQVNYLIRAGVCVRDLDGVTAREARVLIDEIKRRRDNGLCSYPQAKILAKYGHPIDLEFEQAKVIIDGISLSGWPVPDSMLELGGVSPGEGPEGYAAGSD